MVNTWQLSLGPVDHEWITRVIERFQRIESNWFYYPKGNAVMALDPVPGDKVIVTCKAQMIIEGVILKSFVMKNGALHAKVKITSLLTGYCKGHRRNWIKINE